MEGKGRGGEGEGRGSCAPLLKFLNPPLLTAGTKATAQNRDFCLPYLHSTPPLGGSRRNVANPFGVEKLE